MYRGYIKIYRKAEENPLYFSEVFTKWHAWSDLILIANHKEKTLSVRGNLIKINRGQIAHSEASLASRWKWSRGKVRRFINYLKIAQQIEQQQSSILNILTIKNYDIYHGNGTADSTTDGQQTVQQTDTNNNDKNVKNDKKVTTFCLNSIEFQLSELLLNKILERRPALKKPDLKKWALCIDKMIRIDKRLVEEIEKVIEWCQSDTFWQNNILSTSKLREQYDQLALKMLQNKIPIKNKAKVLMDQNIQAGKDFINLMKKESEGLF